ncbi:hypothetical protein FA15DRAFT_671453 [Coprinopsis marcescibilis]|uniref:Uncharacterized protein n=1 Tax=Coprinopsis marcescibilis TaxID=230819 RepID=A0A5C3KPQ7_COPMA|nr:hypothetical protein FA15DRAFT_671453 [Coprinopsis marcescibilis]
MNASADFASNSRAEQRRQKLLDAEREQQAEELEALKMTEEQFHTLKRSFMSVKFEFYDLDGLRWTPSALYSRQYRARTSWQATKHSEIPSSTSATKEEYKAFYDETIRTPSRPRPYPSLLKTSNNGGLFQTPVTTAMDSLSFQAKYRNRDGGWERLPAKTLFQVSRDQDERDSAWNMTDNDQYSCPPSPMCPSIGVFDNNHHTYQRYAGGV